MNAEERELYRYLREMVNADRLDLIEQILDRRTRYLAVVLEDIYQPHNASAVFRSCDCFGIQDVHVIENRNTLETIREVELGSAQWLSIYRHNAQENNTVHTLNRLRSQGYRLVATTPHKEDTQLEDFDLSAGKTALLFGTEIRGLSLEALEMADAYVKIPMVGFTESFNISVSAAIILYQLRQKLEASRLTWQLTEEEKAIIRYHWVKNSVKNVSMIEKALRKRLNI